MTTTERLDLPPDGDSPPPNQAAQWVRSHLELRTFVGYVGFFLPISVVVFNWIWSNLGRSLDSQPSLGFWASVQGSISGYYYTSAGNIFVGCMVTFGVFLITYKYGPAENRTGNVAGVAAIVVGICPTSPRDASTIQTVVGVVHLIAAGTFFVCMAIFCHLFIHDRFGPVRPARVRTFEVCRFIVALCIAAAALGMMALPDEVKDATRYLLWPESIAVIAFAVAWTVKGRPVRTTRTVPARSG